MVRSMKVIIGIAAVVAVLGAGYWFIFMSGQSNAGAQNSLGITLNYGESASTTQQQAGAQDTAAQAAPQTTNDNKKVMQAILHTTKGDITIEFSAADAPNTVANFVKLASAGFYDGTKFHRVIKGFMIQGGDPLSKDDSMMARWGTGGPGYQFNDELGPNNHDVTGTIAMANAGPNTNGSQFFINVADNNFLDTKHTVFGRVTAGMDVVHAIENTQTGQNDRPVEPMVITSITLK